MRERFLEAFDLIRVDNLNGDKYRTGKLTPEGKPDPSIFSTEKNREGIQVGTAIGLLVKGAEPSEGVQYRDWWGASKRAELEVAASSEPTGYETHKPVLELGLPFRPAEIAEGYLSWPKIPELFPVSFPGIITARDSFVVDVDKDVLEQRLMVYFNPACSDDEVARVSPAAMADASRFEAIATRRRLVSRGFLADRLVPYQYRPFDTRWIYWEPDTKLLHEKRSN